MRGFCCHLVLAYVALAGSRAAAQAPGEIHFVLQETPSPEAPTLPEVVVTPESASQPTPSDLPDYEGGALGSGAAFPSLSDQTFGGLNGLTAGSGSLFDTPQFGTITTKQELRERQSSDMVRALQTEVGVLIQQTARGQAAPFIRGLTGQEVVILIDGVRINNSVLRAGPNQYFNTIDPGSIDHIEVIRGSQSVLWGSDAIGGAINIVTRSADPFLGNYATPGAIQYFGSADTSSYTRFNGEGWQSNAGVFSGASYLNVNDLERGGDLGRQPFTSYDQYAGDVKYDQFLGEDSMFTVCLQHFEQDSVPRSDRFRPFVNQINPNAAERPTWFDPQQRDLAYGRLQGLSINPFFDSYSATVSYQRTKEGLIEENLTTNPQRLEIGEFDVDTLGTTFIFARDFDFLGTLTYGCDWYYDDIDSFKNRYNRTTGGFIGPVVPQYPDDSIYQRSGGFLQWGVDVTERLAVYPGVRYEHISLSGTPVITVNGVNTPVPFERAFDDWVAQVGCVYELTDSLNAVGGFYEGFRAPNLDDLVSTKTFQQSGMQFPTITTLDVQPENAYTYECGFKLDTPRFRSQVIEYWIDFEDYITRIVDANNNAILTNVDAYINGTELAGEYLLDGSAAGWSVWGNFWYTYGRNRTQDESFSRIPPAQGFLGLRRRDEQLRGFFDVFVWMVRRQDRLSSLNTGDARFPPDGQPGFATLNFRAGRFLDSAGRHRLTLGLENVTDKYYRVFGSGVDGAGINGLLGYEWTR